MCFNSGSSYGNEFMIGWRNPGIITLGVQNYFTNIPLSSGYNMEALWTNWHKHCFTWKASGSVKVNVFFGNIIHIQLAKIGHRVT